MTCIVALETQRGVWMGHDQLGSDGFTGAPIEAPKVFTNGPLLIGMCGSFRMGQLLQYGLHPPEESLSWDVDRWVAMDLVPAIREAFEAGGWDRINNGRAKGGSFLVVVRGRCYEVQDDYSFMRMPSGEYAVGSGTYHALGSLHTTRDWAKPKERIVAALEAAAEYVMSVAPPFAIVRQAKE